MISRWSPGLLLCLLAALGCATGASPRVAAPRQFDFHSNFWLNLHLFARVVARGMPAPQDLTPEERVTWDAGVAFYRERYAERDLVFDDGMIEIKEVLRRAPDQVVLEGTALDPALRETLARLAPIYRRYWWPAHDAANRAWIAAAEPLVAAHGRELGQRVAQAYGVSWPNQPIPVDLSVTAGPLGGYTTGHPVTHTTIASTDPRFQGLAALEMLFHEASHAWGTLLQGGIAKAEGARHKTVPKQLWHAVLFYNAGELTRRTLEQHGVSGYVEHALRQNVYAPLCGEGCRERVVAAWDPHLAGKTTLDQALDALVAAWPAQ
jgi:hypothetical protein